MGKMLTVTFCMLFAWTWSRSNYELATPPQPEVVVDVECQICQTAIKSNTNWSSRYFTEEKTSYFCSEDCMIVFNQWEQDGQDD